MTGCVWPLDRPPFTVLHAEAGSVVYAAGGHYGPRIQQDVQLVLVHTGQASIRVDDAVHHIPPGSVALLTPGHVEEFVFSTTTETWHRWVQIRPSSWPPETVNQLSNLPVYIPLSDSMNQLADVILALSHSPIASPEDNLLCMLGLSALMLYASESRHKGLTEKRHPAVRLAKAHIHENYQSPCTLKVLASVANVSAEYLVRLFQQSEGVTPIRYLWRIRACRAIELLRSTGLSLEEIADQTGFQSLYHLSRTVKSATGTTPTEIRHGNRPTEPSSQKAKISKEAIH